MSIKLTNPITEETERKGTFVPNGKYLVKVNKCEERTPMKGGENYLNIELEIVDAIKADNEPAIGLRIFEKLSLSDAARWKLVAFLDACYPPKFVGNEIDVDGLWLVVEAKEEEYEGRTNVRCKGFTPAKNWKGATLKLDSEGNQVGVDKSVDKSLEKENHKSSSEEVTF